MRIKLVRFLHVLTCRCLGHRWRHHNHRSVDSASRSCQRCQRFEVADMQNERWLQIK